MGSGSHRVAVLFNITRDELRNYLLYLKLERKLAIRSLNIHIYALKCFFEFILPEADIMGPYKRLKEPKYHPDVLSREEVKVIIDTEENLKYKAILATLYSSGIRLEECVNLDVNDIDSSRMIIHVRQGKGGKDRITILSPRALEILRAYWLQFKPRTCLFEGNVKGKRIHRRTVEEIVAIAAYKAGLRRRLKTHSLRHSFATHLLEDGVPLQVIQRLLGHERIDTTSINASFKEYLHTHGRLPMGHYRAVNAIMNCRTEALGSHQYECENCHDQQTHCHSCRNRHCPHCQGYASMQWVQSRVNEMLPGKVTFSYTDYNDDNKCKTMSLSAVEFIRRFLLHVLPQGFMRIRHFGFFSNRDRTEHVNLCRKLLGEYAVTAKETLSAWWEQILERTGKNPLICRKCDNGLLRLIMVVPPRRWNCMIT